MVLLANGRQASLESASTINEDQSSHRRMPPATRERPEKTRGRIDGKGSQLTR